MKFIDLSLLNYECQYQSHIIRIGSIRDGGYYVTKRLVEASKFFISGGISYNAKFERDFLDINPKCDIILVDGSFNLLLYIIRPFYWLFFKKSYISKIPGLIDMLILKYQVKFIKRFIGVKGGLSITDLFDDYIDNKLEKGYIKLDIEGAEYAILTDILKIKERLLGLAIEFHNVPQHIDIINTFISDLNKNIIGFTINETGGLNSSSIPNTIEICFADFTFVNPNDYDLSCGKIFSNDADNELLVPIRSTINLI